MPRRRPAQLRPRGSAASGPAEKLGLPARTARALDRLGDPALDPLEIAVELAVWRQLVQLPTSVLSAPHSDWTEFVGPCARALLEDAVTALNRVDGAPLRDELARLDVEFERKTAHNPLADPALPWWSRRWTH